MSEIISPSFEIAEFVDAVKDKDLHEIIRIGEREKELAEKSAPESQKGESDSKRLDYASCLRDFLYFLEGGMSTATRNSDFKKFRPIVENLRYKKQLSSHSIEAFDESLEDLS